MNCSNCGTPYNDGDAFCPNCGTALGGTISDSSDIHCPNCGAINPYGSMHCMNCGSKLTKQPKGEKNTNTVLIVGLSIIAAVCVIAVFIIIFGGRKDDSDVSPNPTLPAITFDEEKRRASDEPHEPEPHEERHTPIPLKTPKPAPVYVEYYPFTDYDYSFSCNYPGGFHTISPLSSFTHLSLEADNGSGKIYICATENNNGRDINKIAENFLTSHTYSTVVFDERKTNYCSVMIRNEYEYFYCYHTLYDGLIRGFEMQFNDEHYDEFTDYAINMQSSMAFY